MFKLEWDKTSERLYETGVDRGVVYPMVNGAYPKGEAWNGLTATNISPSGAEPTALYANNKKYLNLMSAEEVAGTIEAYMYPDSFGECNGEKEIATGVKVTSQKRKPFGFTFRNLIGNDTEGTTHGYKIHIIYNALAAPSEDANATVNDSPEGKTMSWEFSTTPVSVKDSDPTAHIIIDSTKVPADKLTALEEKLYGKDETEAMLPLPDEIAELVGTEALAAG